MMFLRSLLMTMLFALLHTASATKLNVTAITAEDDASKFQCWQMASPLESSSQPGIVGTQTAMLGDVSNFTYNVIPAGYDSGDHTVPANQWAMVLYGQAVITIPNNASESVTTSGGELSLFFFADKASVSAEGHGSLYPGITETIFVQIPTKDGEIPEHESLYDGPCAAAEYSGLRGMATAS